MTGPNQNRKITIKLEPLGSRVDIDPGISLLGAAQKAGIDLNAGVRLKQTGCIGLCSLEPIVQVIEKDRPPVTYGKVTPLVARQIFQEHIQKGLVLQEHVVDKI